MDAPGAHVPPTQGDGHHRGMDIRTNTPLVSARNLTRVWGKGHAAQLGVDGVDLDLARGEILAIVGPSGSGKSTLGALLAGIDVPTRGSLVVDGARVDAMSPNELARWRGANVGIVFQNFHLLPTLTAVENVELALDLGGRRTGSRRRRRLAQDALARVGLDRLGSRLPAQLSGGEQQRVAIARAIVRSPRLLVADEPTGSLDQENGRLVFALLTGLSREGTTVVFITHDVALSAAAHRTLVMVDGRVSHILSSSGGSPAHGPGAGGAPYAGAGAGSGSGAGDANRDGAATAVGR
jgi:putative ABC transport system ATP-binding protein